MTRHVLGPCWCGGTHTAKAGGDGCYRDVAVFLLVVVPLVAFAAGVIAAVRHYEENPSE